MSLPDFVKLVEVGARDGLQNEKTLVPLDTKLELIHRLGNAGIKHIEAGSFVSPKWVPQMADSGEVFKQLSLNNSRKDEVTYAALTPNIKGYDAAVAVDADEVAVFAAASESFSLKNTNCSIDECLQRIEAIITQAKKDKLLVRGYVSCVMGCPYEGEIDPAAVLKVSKALLEMGCYEISLGDTIGTGTPQQTRQLIQYLSNEIPVDKLAVHFHDTYGQALANIYAALLEGVSVVDSSVAGLGGCPYAQGASGNVASEDVLYMLQGLGIQTDINLAALVETGNWISQQLDRPNQSKAGLALFHKKQNQEKNND